MSKIVVIVATVILISLFGFTFFSSKQTVSNSPTPGNSSSQQTIKSSVTPITDLQASFAIFTNGTFRVFTAAMYHNLTKDVYIEASNPNRVRVKKAGTTWNDFFSTLPFKLTTECLTTGTKETFCTGKSGALQFYINGEKNTNALSQEIKEGDRLLVTFGKESDAQIKQQIDKVP